MATLTVIPLSLATPIDDVGMAATNATDNFLNDGLTFLYFKNTSGASVTVTPVSSVLTVTPTGYGAITYADTGIAVAAGTSKLIGPFGPSRFNGAGGLATYNVSAAGASFMVKAIRLTPIA